MYTFNFFKEFGTAFHNLVALTPNVRPPPPPPLKVKGKLIQSREQFITICSRVGVKDNACTSPLETKNPLQILNGARGPYIGGIQDCFIMAL